MKTIKKDSAPRVAVRLLQRTLPEKLSRAVAGDLQEEWEQASRTGPARSRLWFWRESLALCARFGWERFPLRRWLAQLSERRYSPQNGWDDGNKKQQKGDGLMQTFWQDLRYGVRMLRRNPGFTAVAVLTLALGIGANTAIFSIVNTVLLRPLPYENPEELVLVWESNPSKGRRRFSVSPPNFLDWREQSNSFEHLAAYWASSEVLTGLGDADRIQTMRVSSGFFETVRARVVMGRSFLPEEEIEGNHRVAVISHSFWQSRLGGDPGVLERTLDLSGERYTIVGVTESEFQYFGDPTLWLPAAHDPENMPGRGAHWNTVLGRLKDGVSREKAEAEMKTIAAGLEQTYPDSNTGWTVALVDLTEQTVGRARTPLLILLGAVGFVLLIACANLANLLLARAMARGKEISIRLAHGAGRGRLVRQLLTESALLGLLGGASGLGLGFGGLQALRSILPGNFPRVNEISFDATVFGFAFALSLLTSLLFGLLPALQASRVALVETLKEGGRTSGGQSRHRLRSLLVTVEVGLALMLLVGAGLLMRSFVQLLNTDPGISTEKILTTQLRLPEARYSSDAATGAFYRELLDRLESVPGIRAAGLVHVLPLSGRDWSHAVEIEGHPAVRDSELPSSDFYNVSARYFKAMGIPLLRGRYLSEQDTADTPRVAVINETFAKRHFPDEDPLGKRVRIGNGIPEMRVIVGVVGDVKHHGLASQPPAQIYEPYTQNPFRGQTLVVGTDGDPLGMVPAVRALLRELDKDLPLFSILSMEQVQSGSLAPRRFSTTLIVVFAALALALTLVGIYGIISYIVSQRTHEIGVRLALGARRGDILRLVLGKGLWMTGLGIGWGLAGAYFVGRLLQNQLFAVTATDPITFAAVAVLLLTVALLACYIPARRATNVDPMVALRYE